MGVASSPKTNRPNNAGLTNRITPIEAASTAAMVVANLTVSFLATQSTLRPMNNGLFVPMDLD